MTESDLSLPSSEWQLCDLLNVPHYLDYHPVVEDEVVKEILKCVNPRLWRTDEKGATRIATNFGRLRDYDYYGTRDTS